MTSDEYQVLLWVMETHQQGFGLVLVQTLAAWGSLALTNNILQRLLQTLELHLDHRFWNDTLEP